LRVRLGSKSYHSGKDRVGAAALVFSVERNLNKSIRNVGAALRRTG
jgi:hypothetical protein